MIWRNAPSSRLQDAKIADMKVEAILGDITKQHVDAIVNAANSALAGGGGVDGAIHRAAGAAKMHAACARLGGCTTGDAKVTPGFSLPAKWVIHTVGPRYRDGRHGEKEALASCYRRSCEVAEELKAASLAFPAISTGIYGYPAEEAAQVAVATLIEFEPVNLELVRLVAFDDYTLSLYYRELGMRA